MKTAQPSGIPSCAAVIRSWWPGDGNRPERDGALTFVAGLRKSRKGSPSSSISSSTAPRSRSTRFATARRLYPRDHGAHRKAGVHSGDSMAVYPPRHLDAEERETIVEYTRRIVLEMDAIGLTNIQYVCCQGSRAKARACSSRSEPARQPDRAVPVEGDWRADGAARGRRHAWPQDQGPGLP